MALQKSSADVTDQYRAAEGERFRGEIPYSGLLLLLPSL